MRTLRLAVVVATLVSTSSYALMAEAKVRDTQATCRTSDGNGWSSTDLHQAARCVISHWSVPGGYRKADSVIRCESSWHPHESNSCCHGLLQLHESYFGGWFRRFNPHRGWRLRHAIENPRTNLVIGLRLAHAGGWSPWSCS